MSDRNGKKCRKMTSLMTSINETEWRITQITLLFQFVIPSSRIGSTTHSNRINLEFPFGSAVVDILKRTDTARKLPHDALSSRAQLLNPTLFLHMGQGAKND
jgi:hypothetical protein